MIRLKIGVVQPKRDEDVRENIRTALKYIELAPDDLDMLIFPEGFPGPWWLAPDEKAKEVISKSINESEAYMALRNAIKDKDFLIAFGLTERVGNELFNAYALMDKKGELKVYRKILPAAFEINAPSPISQAKEIKVWDVKGTKVGVNICWEALFPELPRMTAKKGAELLLFPTGGMLLDLRNSWKNVWLARAVENVAFVAGCVSIYGDEEGMAIIAGPEGVLVESSTTGIITADLDIERIRWLREIEEELQKTL